MSYRVVEFPPALHNGRCKRALVGIPPRRQHGGKRRPDWRGKSSSDRLTHAPRTKRRTRAVG
jgi:hypothetical protein